MRGIILPVLLLVLSGIASADNFSKYSNRTHHWEFGLLLNHVDSWELRGRNGSTIDVDSDTGLGFQLGYNVDEHIYLGFEFTHNSQAYDASVIPVNDPADPTNTGTPVDVHHTLDNDAFNFNFAYNFLTKTFTPYVSGSLGWTYLDSNIPSSETGTVCWWDPWWGYICSDYVSTYNTTPFSFGIGAGLRWDVGRQMVIRASIDRRWFNVDGVNDNTEMYIGKLGLSWMM